VTDLREFYLTSLGPQIVALAAALESLEKGASEAGDSIARVAHQLKGSGASYGFAEVTDRAAEVLSSSGSDLVVSTRSLIELLGELASSAVAGDQTVVVIEDDPVMQVLLGKSIEGPGRELLMASTLAEGRKHLTHEADLLFLDLFLPDGDGRQLLAEVRRDPATANLLVVVLSGADSDLAKAECLALGADAFLTKPFEPSSLTTLVDTLLRADTRGDRRGGATAMTPIEESSAPNSVPVSLSVLLAEDDKLVAALIVDRLGRDGFTVVHCVDGEAALAQARRNPPDLAILDVKMPKMDGFEVLSRFRDSADLSEVPVIILTAMGGEQDVVRGLDLGADDYILKPFSPSELVARAHRLLSKL
jgi:DNA-binding response OmpR family regulator/HPt (histidine-containing phosphotransfer) domain-containing protein